MAQRLDAREAGFSRAFADLLGAKREIYGMIRALADGGAAILMISSDMEEVIGVSDRIAVMHEGQISGILDRDDFSQENVLLLAVGKKPR